MTHSLMLIDDDEVIVRLAEMTVCRLGHRCAGFTRPEDAIAALSKAPDAYDLVLCDAQLGATSGFEIVRELRRLNATVPILMISGAVASADVATARDAGAAEILPKSEVMTNLRGVFERLLEHRRGS